MSKGRRGEDGLTPKQRAFCHAYIETGNASEAYRRSYNAENSNQNSIKRRACALMADDTIATTIEQLQSKVNEAAVKKLELTREFVIEGLLRNAQIGAQITEDGKPVNLAASNQALVALGKIDTLGLFVERSKIELSKTFDEMTDEELDEFIASKSRG
jgi:hypothetical protein